MFTFFLHGTPTSLHMIDDDCLQSTSTQYFILFSVFSICVHIYLLYIIQIPLWRQIYSLLDFLTALISIGYTYPSK